VSQWGEEYRKDNRCTCCGTHYTEPGDICDVQMRTIIGGEWHLKERLCSHCRVVYRGFWRWKRDD